MKTLSIVIILAFAAMTDVSTHAAAQELTLNPPDINGKLNALVEQKMDTLNGKLNALVEQKMDTLMESKDAVQGQPGVRKQLTDTGEQGPEVTQDSLINVVSDSRD